MYVQTVIDLSIISYILAMRDATDYRLFANNYKFYYDYPDE